MPVLFEEKSTRDSSAEKEPPLIEVVSRNCSIEYCFAGRREASRAPVDGRVWAAAATADARMSGAIHFIVRSCWKCASYTVGRWYGPPKGGHYRRPPEGGHYRQPLKTVVSNRWSTAKCGT